MHPALKYRPFFKILLSLLFLFNTPALAIQKAPQKLLNQAQEALDDNRLEEAADLLKEILKIETDNHIARKALIDVMMRLMLWEEAQKEIIALRLARPKDPQAAFLAAAIAFRVGEFSRATELSTEALELKDPPKEAWRIRALSHFMTQNYEEFQNDMRTLIDKDPLNPEPHYHLGRYFFETQIFKKAEAEFRSAIKKSPRHYRAFYYLGWCQWAGGELEKARASYLESIEIIQREGVAYGWPFSDLGELLITQNKFDEGLSWLYSAIRNDPELPYAHFKYASALFKKETTSEVETELLKALELDPGYTEAYYVLGSYYRKTGNREAAVEALKKFQELRKNPVASMYGVRRK